MSETDTDTTDASNENNSSAAAASWEEGRRRFGREMEKRKVREYPIPTEEGEDPMIWRFTIRKLTGEERSSAEDAAVNVEENRNKTEISMDSRAVKREIIKAGVVEGPEGFKCTDRHVDQLIKNSPEVAEDLADSIENFSKIDEEERVAF